jgi:hypothetical protein
MKEEIEIFTDKGLSTILDGALVAEVEQLRSGESRTC